MAKAGTMESDSNNTMSQSRNRRIRKRQTLSSNASLASISEVSVYNGNGKPSLTIPMVILVFCLATIVGSPNEYLDLLRRRRTLLALTPEHVNQYPFTNFLEVNELDPVGQKKVIGMYWQIPRCGGTTLKHILGTCLRRTAAARTSADYCNMNTDKLETCQTKVGTFVNADPSDHGGIQRCERMKLIESGIPDVIVSSRILHAATLYDPDHKGRLFTIMRNPIERAVSTFYYLQNAYWERHYRPELKEMTILDYAALPDTANNWMTRWLTGKNAEPHLTRQDLAFAKELLRRKFLILLTDEMATSIERLLYYMNWIMDESHFEETRACLLANTKKDQGQNRNKHLMPDMGSPEYEALLAINHLDVELYEYATELFKEQHAVMMKRRNQRSSELFIEGGVTQSDAIGKASQSSEYEAAMAAAALMERPPEESAMKSVEATNNLVATALLMKMPNRTSTRKDSSNMIASVLAKKQGSANKWHQSLGVAVQTKELGVQSTGTLDARLVHQTGAIQANEVSELEGNQSLAEETHMIQPAVTTPESTAPDNALQKEQPLDSIDDQGQKGRM